MVERWVGGTACQQLQLHSIPCLGLEPSQDMLGMTQSPTADDCRMLPTRRRNQASEGRPPGHPLTRAPTSPDWRPSLGAAACDAKPAVPINL